MSLDAGSLYLKLLEMCMDKELDLATDEPKYVNSLSYVLQWDLGAIPQTVLL